MDGSDIPKGNKPRMLSQKLCCPEQQGAGHGQGCASSSKDDVHEEPLCLELGGATLGHLNGFSPLPASLGVRWMVFKDQRNLSVT
jgi:hypothetical protein